MIPSQDTRAIKVVSQDERRFGLLTVRRRRLTACGVQPIGTIQHVLEWLYVYGAVAPTTGEHVFLAVPPLHSSPFQVVLDQFAQAFHESLTILVLDKRGGHSANGLVLPAHVRRVWLPPASPELTPIDRVWRDRKDAIAWQQFIDLEAQQE